MKARTERREDTQLHASGTTRMICALLAVVAASWGPVGCVCGWADAGGDAPLETRLSERSDCCASTDRAAETRAASAGTQPYCSPDPVDPAGACECGRCSIAAVDTPQAQTTAILSQAGRQLTHAFDVVPAGSILPPSTKVVTLGSMARPPSLRADSLFALHCLLTT